MAQQVRRGRAVCFRSGFVVASKSPKSTHIIYHAERRARGDQCALGDLGRSKGKHRVVCVVTCDEAASILGVGGACPEGAGRLLVEIGQLRLASSVLPDQMSLTVEPRLSEFQPGIAVASAVLEDAHELLYVWEALR